LATVGAPEVWAAEQAVDVTLNSPRRKTSALRDGVYGAGVAFWRALQERLGRLSNRVDAETQGKIVGAIDDCIPMVTTDELIALQLEAAKAEAQILDDVANMTAGMAAGNKALANVAE
jgi:hypothetical protein